VSTPRARGARGRNGSGLIVAVPQEKQAVTHGVRQMRQSRFGVNPPRVILPRREVPRERVAVTIGAGGVLPIIRRVALDVHGPLQNGDHGRPGARARHERESRLSFVVFDVAHLSPPRPGIA
jgi:hypothetical protein